MPTGNAIPASNSNRATHLTTFTVKIDGQALDPNIGVIQLDIDNAINAIPSAFLMLQDGNLAAQSFALSTSDQLIPGKEIEITGGYNMEESTIFKGIITKHKIKSRSGGSSYLQIECKDPVYKMSLDRKSRYFKNVSDGDLFDEIAGSYDDISIEFEQGGAPSNYPEITQYYMSDWDFLLMRAEKLGMFCIVDNGTISIEKLPTVPLPAFSLAFGLNIIDLDLEMDARTQFVNVNTLAWDDNNQAILSGTSSDVRTPDQGNISAVDLANISNIERKLLHGGTLTQQELDAWAEGEMLKSRMSKIKGIVKFQGNENALPGTIISIKGMGERFNGNAFISGIQHALGRGEWITSAQLGFDLKWHYQKFDALAYPGSGFSSAINGLQIGIVTQLQDDPDGRERILVRLPIVNPDDEGTWMRWASLDAGNQRGFVFRPEIDDEVIVGFLNDDPNQAVILGMLHSINKPAPIAASNDNHEKGLVTREQLKVLFNDEVKSILISTPNKNEVLISDDEGSISIRDQNENTITLSKDGISLESAKDITLKATGDIKMEGVNIECKASANFKAEGSAKTEVSSSGTTTVKGSLVQIN